MTERNLTSRKRVNAKHKISWPMKLTLALAFLPSVWLIIAIVFHLWLPALPWSHLVGGDEPNHLLFVDNTPKNLSESVIFSSICLGLGLSLFSYLSLEKGSLRVAWQDIIINLRQDLQTIFSPQAPEKSDQTTDATAPAEAETKEPLYNNKSVARARNKDVPETSL
jgi:hypothetical protein